VKTRSVSLGKILVNGNAQTLYLFEKDKNGKSACSGQCAKFWPPVLTKGKPKAGTGVKESLLGTTKRADGSSEVTYAGHPLYTFAGDTQAGQTNGQGSNGFGAPWWVVTPAGKALQN
jgi:predicted lipoprotein with Yx(FWY)xxD motif